MVAPVEGSTSTLYILFSAMLAISALILPGISGSFVLLLLGMYTYVTGSIKSFLTSFSGEDLHVILTFGVGALIGLAVFSRVLSWMFDKYKDVTFAMITGFMLGSLAKIWPWRNVTQILEKSTGNKSMISDASTLTSMDPETYKIIAETNVMPSAYQMGDPKVILVMVALVVGFLIIILPHRLSKAS